MIINTSDINDTTTKA